MRCTCPGPCEHCGPLDGDDQADREYRSTRYLFLHKERRPRGAAA